MKKSQKETIVSFDESSERVNVFTHNSDLKKRLKAFAKKYPKLCRLIDDDGIGGMAFEVDRKRFGFQLTHRIQRSGNVRQVSWRRKEVWEGMLYKEDPEVRIQHGHRLCGAGVR